MLREQLTRAAIRIATIIIQVFELTIAISPR
jgi:hypothetical protein